MAIDVLYEDNHLIAVNKPAGALSQGDKTGDAPLLEEVREYIRVKYRKPGDVFLGLIHRIDRPVSGVLLFARTSKALTRMNKMFQDKEVQKTYWAVVCKKPVPAEGQLNDFLVKDSKKNKSFVVKQGQKGAKAASLSYRLLFSLENYHLIEVKPYTGRPHQIRVQLANIGAVIKGDLKYGAPRSNKDASICLHAKAVDFIHPVKKEPIRIEALLPQGDAIWNACAEWERKKGH
jgi:23S rRNA pseudouridine1911/1915/1917 synthase